MSKYKTIMRESGLILDDARTVDEDTGNLTDEAVWTDAQGRRCTLSATVKRLNGVALEFENYNYARTFYELRRFDPLEEVEKCFVIASNAGTVDQYDHNGKLLSFFRRTGRRAVHRSILESYDGYPYKELITDSEEQLFAGIVADFE